MAARPVTFYIVVHVKDHEVFERQGDDLFCEIPIKFTLATLGGTIQVPTLQGKATLKICRHAASGSPAKVSKRTVTGINAPRSREVRAEQGNLRF